MFMVQSQLMPVKDGIENPLIPSSMKVLVESMMEKLTELISGSID